MKKEIYMSDENARHLLLACMKSDINVSKNNFNKKFTLVDSCKYNSETMKKVLENGKLERNIR